MTIRTMMMTTAVTIMAAITTNIITAIKNKTGRQTGSKTGSISCSGNYIIRIEWLKPGARHPVSAKPTTSLMCFWIPALRPCKNAPLGRSLLESPVQACRPVN
jgi:hypothetical protein